MPTVRIPLILPFTSRTWVKTIGSSQKDQQAINALYEVSENKQLGTRNVYCHKRPGSSTGTTYASGVIVLKHYCGNFFDALLFATPTAFYNNAATSLGVLTAAISDNNNYVLGDAVISNVGVLTWVTTDNKGWFLYSDAISTNFPTFTGDRTSGSPIITNIASTTGIYKGQAISGTGIPASTRVLSVDSATQITMSANATSGAPTTTTITKEAIAQITDTDFPSDAKAIVAMGGYFFAGSGQGRIYNSALNDPATWVATDFVSTDTYGDQLLTIFKHGQYIVGIGQVNGLQYFYIGGTTSGSVLSAANHLTITGLTLFSAPVTFQSGVYCTGKSASGSYATNLGLPGLYRLNGTNTFTRVSDDIVGSIIAAQDLNIIGHAECGDKTLVLLHATSETNILAYDESTDTFTAFSTASALTSAFSTTFTLSGESARRGWNGSLFEDSSVAYTMTLIAEPWDGGTMNDKTIKKVTLIADNQASGTASISWSDDDYANFSTARTVDMTAINKKLDACGTARRRAFKVEHSANTDFRAQAIEVDYTINAT